MGTWGRRLYENDVALDVRDMIDDVLEESTSLSVAADAVVRILDRDYADSDDQAVAWLVAADRLLCKEAADIPGLWRRLRESGSLPAGTLLSLRHSLADERLLKRRRPPRPPFQCAWKPGDVYLLDVAPQYRDDPAFAGCSVGFLCFDLYKYRGLHPLVYVFRVRASSEALARDPALVLKGPFWRLSNWGARGFCYRALILTRNAREYPAERLHDCGHVDGFPPIADEFVPMDGCGLSLPTLLWPQLEQRLLLTHPLMDVPCEPIEQSNKIGG